MVISWQKDDTNKNKGFGFIDFGGASLFCHKSSIEDGNALWPGTAVTFNVTEDEKKAGNRKAGNVRGGVCFDHSFLKRCSRKGCDFSHAGRPQAPRSEPSLDEAVAAVVASRRAGTAPVLVNTVEECQAHCARLARAGVVAVDFEGVNLCRDGELLLAQEQHSRSVSVAVAAAAAVVAAAAAVVVAAAAAAALYAATN